MSDFGDYVKKNNNVPEILRTVRFCTVVFASIGFLWLNASNFDETEWKAVAGIVVTYLGAEGGTKFIDSFRKSSKEDK